MRRCILKLCLTLLLALSAVPPAIADDAVTLGVFAYREAEEVEARFSPLTEVMSAALEGREVRLEVLDLEALDAAVDAGRLDFVLTNPRHALSLRAERRVGGELVTLLRHEQDHELAYLAGVVLARRDAGIHDLEALKGQTIAIPGQRFLGGFMAQAHELYQRGIAPYGFAEYRELSAHDAVMRALLDGEVVAGFVRSGILEDWQRRGHDVSSLEVVSPRQHDGFPLAHSTGLYPEWPLTALAHVPEDDVRRVAGALLGWEGVAGDGEGLRFAPPKDYLAVEQAARALRITPFAVEPRSLLAELHDRYGLLVWLVPILSIALLAAMVGLILLYRRQSLLNRHLEQERQALEQILWGTAAGTWQWNVQTGETRFNARWAEMVGYHLEEISPTTIETWMAFCHDDDLARSNAQLEAHFAGQRDRYDIEVRMRHRDGHWIWVQDRGRVISWDEAGEPLWMAGTHTDITPRKEAELRAAELIAQMRKHAALLPGALYQYWQHPDGRRAFPYASDGIEAIYGVLPEAIREDAAPVFAVLASDDVPQVAETIARSERELTLWRATFRANHPEKGTIWVEGIAMPERLEDGSTIWHGYLRDVTGEHATQRQLMASREALERSNQELEQFAYAASHDLRQPLRMVTSYAQLLERHLADKLDDDGRTMLHYMRDGAQRMDGMLLSLLDYSRVGRKGQPLQPMALRDALDEALHFLAPEIREAEAQVEVTGEWPRVVASPDEMTRLFQNLLSNAIKYRAPDQAPEITVAVEALPESAGWQVNIRDNGIGIAADQQGRLFQVFQRLHTREQYAGTGVGLAICRKIVERHGGEIRLESPGEGQGSTVILTLPARAEASTAEGSDHG
ncbi:PhnD/SsuA/transferrin family substrate-binding protein [Billgrantia kenyensis]|uniref:histidine kinase n=1 Tax=Billgrantia kenyensis TaxID=321266 RepID=A0A7V9W1U1_9GAMM|nr:PhnD/SsuA/transferrin family substrate-binding protein [Halomonas kenyensis]MBA2779412.1 PhnD/SsuA/transferrin family substrate-binding protein [Halomonas kenyensis]MCG6662440.1 PhnD/SsuA/transferrin family substrate-binding protein [Halomonas kenyensis]